MDVAQKYRLRAEEHDIQLDTRLGEGLPFTAADIAMLDRVLENLVSNALDHCPQGGSIHILVEAKGDAVTLAVCNSGEAIAEEELPHLFERFYQSPQHRHGKGAGLGLAIVKRIVELHGSEIAVERSDDGFNCFHFTLPVWQR
jgi:signal transduction histidine kinase